MAVRRKSSSLLSIIVFVALLAVGYYLFKTGFFTSKTSTTTSKTATKSPTTQVTTTTVAQGAVSGPVGRNGLRAYAGPEAGQVTLEWQRFFLDGENFSIRYGTASKSYPSVISHIGYISTYTVKGLMAGTKYYFVVEGIRIGDVSAGWDGEVSMTAPSSPTTVVVTSGPLGRNLLTATPGPKSGQVTLKWTRYYPDTEKYSIVYGVTPGKYIYGAIGIIDTTPKDNDYHYVVGSLSPGKRYYFAIAPQRSGSTTYNTAEVSAIAP